MNLVSTAVKDRVAAYCSGGDHTRAQLAEAIHMPYSTFMSKLNGPSEFSFSEGFLLARAMDMSSDTLATPIADNPMASAIATAS